MARLTGLLFAVLLLLPACEPTVRLQPPKEPIVVNMNVHITQDVRIRVEEDVEKLLDKNKNLF